MVLTINFDSQFFIPYLREVQYMLVVVDLINKTICYFDNVERPDSKHVEFVASGVVRLHLFLIVYIVWGY